MNHKPATPSAAFFGEPTASALRVRSTQPVHECRNARRRAANTNRTAHAVGSPMEAAADQPLHQTLPLTTYQTEARRLRQEFQTAQAADNATLRNAMATADQTQISTVTQARELYTNSVEDERHEPTVERANTVCWNITSLCFRSNTHPIRSKIPLLRKRFPYV